MAHLLVGGMIPLFIIRQPRRRCKAEDRKQRTETRLQLADLCPLFSDFCLLGGFFLSSAHDDASHLSVVVGDDTGLLALVGQLAVHAQQQRRLQAVLVGVAVFDLLLGVGVELAFEDHHILGGRQGHFLGFALALLAFFGGLGGGDGVAI